FSSDSRWVRAAPYRTWPDTGPRIAHAASGHTQSTETWGTCAHRTNPPFSSIQARRTCTSSNPLRGSRVPGTSTYCDRAFPQRSSWRTLSIHHCPRPSLTCPRTRPGPTRRSRRKRDRGGAWELLSGAVKMLHVAYHRSIDGLSAVLATGRVRPRGTRPDRPPRRFAQGVRARRHHPVPAPLRRPHACGQQGGPVGGRTHDPR